MKKRQPLQKLLLLNQFLQHIHVTPIIGSEILSGIQIDRAERHDF